MEGQRKAYSEYVEAQKAEIAELKKELNAVILAHNYQRPEVQDIADYLGDSLGLSRTAAKMDADVIIFCGVRFMAETAAIICPDKTVLLPVKEALCPMVSMISPAKVRRLKEEHPDAAVVSYVNTSAAVKAESDICCTSANFVNVINSLDAYDEIIFVPDENMVTYATERTTKKLIPYKGFCMTHILLYPEHVHEARSKFPEAEFLAHPECLPEVVELADHVASTSGMVRYVKESDTKQFIIGTEMGLVYRLQKENPDKEFILPTEHLICANMKLTTLGWIIEAMKFMTHEVKVPERIAERARLALNGMLAVR